MKRYSLVFAAVLALFACSMVGVPQAMAKATIKIGHTNAKTHPVGVALEAFKAKTEAVSKGSVQIRVFHAAALGGDPDLIQGVQLGNIEMCTVNAGSYTQFTKEFDIMSLPFMFRDFDHIHKVLDGELGKIYADVLEKKMGSKALAWSTSGARQLFCKMAINKVDDLKGKKIRTMNDPGIIEAFSLFGAIPSPISFGEIYTALQSGVVDGGESSFISWVNSRFVEVAKYGMEINYMDTGRVFVINKKLYDGLSPEDRKAVDEGMKECEIVVRREYKAQDDGIKEKAVAAGGTIVNPDMDSFHKAVEPMYAKFQPTLGKEWIEKIRNVQ